MNSEGTQPYRYMYPLSSKPPSHPGWRITLGGAPRAVQQVLVSFHFEHSSVCMTFPDALTVPRVSNLQFVLLSL